MHGDAVSGQCVCVYSPIGSEGNCTVPTSALKGGKEEAPDSRSKLGLQSKRVNHFIFSMSALPFCCHTYCKLSSCSAAAVESFYTKERWSVPSSPSLQKPLLQVSYASSSSLPARYTQVIYNTHRALHACTDGPHTRLLKWSHSCFLWSLLVIK